MVQAACSQQVKYGDNPAAGKYYDVRGIKMYVETYGQGKPLLLTTETEAASALFHKLSLISQKNIK